MRESSIPGMWRLAPLLQWISCERHLRKLPLSTPDVIIGSPVFALRALARRFPKVPRIYLPHARIAPVEVVGTLVGKSFLLERIAFKLYSHFEQWALLNSATTVRFTNSNIDAFCQFYHLSQKVHFDIILPAVQFPDVAAKPGIGSVIRILFVGRLVESKNIGFLINILAEMKDLSWSLDVVGDGPQRQLLERISARLGLANQIRFHGHKDDVDLFYHKADLFAFPSQLESLSLVVLEAMASGVPPLVIRNDGVKYHNSFMEFLTDGYNSLIAADEYDFAKKLRHSLSNPRSLTMLGINARQLIKEKYTWDHTLDSWDKLLQNTISQVPKYM
jgi:glycosyltransferase involved in cell wall biosynthesis